MEVVINLPLVLPPVVTGYLLLVCLAPGGPIGALLLKCFDSKTDGRARFLPHTAFDDPTAPADALPRESIELRTLVFHDAC